MSAVRWLQLSAEWYHASAISATGDATAGSTLSDKTTRPSAARRATAPINTTACSICSQYHRHEKSPALGPYWPKSVNGTSHRQSGRRRSSRRAPLSVDLRSSPVKTVVSTISKGYCAPYHASASPPPFARCIPSSTISTPPSACWPACLLQSAAKVRRSRFSYPSCFRAQVKIRKAQPAAEEDSLARDEAGDELAGRHDGELFCSCAQECAWCAGCAAVSGGGWLGGDRRWRELRACSACPACRPPGRASSETASRGYQLVFFLDLELPARGPDSPPAPHPRRGLKRLRGRLARGRGVPRRSLDCRRVDLLEVAHHCPAGPSPSVSACLRLERGGGGGGGCGGSTTHPKHLPSSPWIQDGCFGAGGGRGVIAAGGGGQSSASMASALYPKVLE